MGINFNRIFPILRFFDIAKADEFAPLRQLTSGGRPEVVCRRPK